jgi:tripartite-type tricarboxylate transporter receptor subunit TctC
LKVSRRRFLHFTAGATAVATAPVPAWSSTYPAHPMTMVVPFAAGGPTDVIGRFLAQRVSQVLGQQIHVENVTGGGGTIGSLRVAKAAPDGYSMVLGNLGSHAASVGIYKHLSYDPVSDFEPVILAAKTLMSLVVKKDMQVTTLQNFIRYARANKGKLSFGSAGIGSVSHLTLVLFNSLTDANIQHVPYRGTAQAMNDILSGQIDGMFDQVVTTAQHIVSGGVRAIVVAAPERAAQIPDVPSSAEAGLPDFVTIAWSALFFPKATPKPLVEQMNAAVDQVMRDEATARRMAEIGADAPPLPQRTPEALASLVRSEIDKWVPVIRAAGVAQ